MWIYDTCLKSNYEDKGNHPISWLFGLRLGITILLCTLFKTLIITHLPIVFIKPLFSSHCWAQVIFSFLRVGWVAYYAGQVRVGGLQIPLTRFWWTLRHLGCFLLKDQSDILDVHTWYMCWIGLSVYNGEDRYRYPENTPKYVIIHLKNQNSREFHKTW